MNKITRTLVKETIITGYAFSNPSDVRTFTVPGSVADPAVFAKKEMKLAKSDCFVVTEMKEDSHKYEMDIETFIVHAKEVE